MYLFLSFDTFRTIMIRTVDFSVMTPCKVRYVVTERTLCGLHPNKMTVHNFEKLVPTYQATQCQTTTP